MGMGGEEREGRRGERGKERKGGDMCDTEEGSGESKYLTKQITHMKTAAMKTAAGT